MFLTGAKCEGMSRHFFSAIFRCAAVMLIAMIWSSLAVCGEIHNATKDGDLEKVKALLKDNPDLVFSRGQYGDSPLHLAATAGHKDVAELLLANKAEVNAKNDSGGTPLVAAADYGHEDIAALLL